MAMPAQPQVPVAYSVEQFLCAYPFVGRTKFYQLIKKGELILRKCGRRSFVLRSDAESWAAKL